MVTGARIAFAPLRRVLPNLSPPQPQRKQIIQTPGDRLWVTQNVKEAVHDDHGRLPVNCSDWPEAN